MIFQKLHKPLDRVFIKMCIWIEQKNRPRGGIARRQFFQDEVIPAPKPMVFRFEMQGDVVSPCPFVMQPLQCSGIVIRRGIVHNVDFNRHADRVLPDHTVNAFGSQRGGTVVYGDDRDVA